MKGPTLPYARDEELDSVRCWDAQTHYLRFVVCAYKSRPASRAQLQISSAIPDKTPLWKD